MYISGASGTGVRGAVLIQILADQLFPVSGYANQITSCPPPLRIFKPSNGSDHVYRMKKRSTLLVVYFFYFKFP